MSQTIAPPARQRRRILPIVVGVFAIALVALILLWNWDWFIPLVEAQASAATGRRVTIGHLHVHLGRNTTVTADDVVIANPDGFPATKPFVRIGTLSVTASIMDYVRHRTIVLPDIAIDQPDIQAEALPDGRNNFTLKPTSASSSNAPPPQIGNLSITDGHARVIDPAIKSDFALGIATFAATPTRPGELVVTSAGTYAGQPITGKFVGGALLSLRDAKHAYPIDLHAANGATKVSLVGTVENPLNFAGARLKLTFSGPDMAQLFPLTNVPFPHTPPFSIAGDLDYQKPTFRFHNLEGRVGSSDLSGDIDEKAEAGGKPDVTMNLLSHRLDLADLGGFIGAPPGKTSTPDETSSQKAAIAAASKQKTLFPSTPLNLPKLRAADIHLKYTGEHIENRFTPFDNLRVTMDVVDGRITLHPLDFGVGQGQIASTIDLDPGAHDIVHADAKIRFRDINIARLMEATHNFKGQGLIGGDADIDTYGNSLASMMAQGNGELKLILISGGNLSALLIDITGLEFGNALLSALGVPNRANIECFVTDLPMHAGVVDTKVLLLDTNEARLIGKGSIDFRNQTLDYSITTRSKHFSIGSLPGPIDITGPLGDPSIRPGTEVMARAGAAAGLGVLLTPLGALLPTIQFGTGEGNACYKAKLEEKQPLRAPAPSRRRAHK
jgi:uncharacterized protein involved in outer membrane biogenesis